MSTLNARLVNVVGTAAEWTLENPTLLLGEIGVESDTRKFKVGDGVSAWVDLDYVYAGGGDVPSPHTLGGDHHSPDTLAALNAKITDGNLDDAGAARPPTAHAGTHATGGADPITPAAINAATAAQGTLAETAVQPAALGTAAAANVGDFDPSGAAAAAYGDAVQRINHVGTQAIATVDGLQLALDSKVESPSGIQNIVVVDHGALPVTRDPNTLYFEREQVV